MDTRSGKSSNGKGRRVADSSNIKKKTTTSKPKTTATSTVKRSNYGNGVKINICS